MPIYVINLDRSVDRLASVSGELRKIGRPWQRHRAIDMAMVDPASVPQYRSPRCRRIYGRDLTGGEIGCFLSHIECCGRILESDAEMALVLEDDVRVHDDTDRLLLELESWLSGIPSESWDVANLSAIYAKRRRLAASLSGLRVFNAYYFPTLSSALLWSRQGAQKLLRHVEERGIFGPIDDQLRWFIARDGFGLSLSQPIFLLSEAETTIPARPTPGAKKWTLRKLARKVPTYLYSTTRCVLRRQGRARVLPEDGSP